MAARTVVFLAACLLNRLNSINAEASVPAVPVSYSSSGPHTSLPSLSADHVGTSYQPLLDLVGIWRGSIATRATRKELDELFHGKSENTMDDGGTPILVNLHIVS